MVCGKEHGRTSRSGSPHLLHHVTPELLRESFYALKRKAAPGVDGVTWQEYETGLEDRLNDLHGRVHRGAYRAQPSKRVWIPKDNGKQRPLGIAALEDKIVQQAVVTVLNADLRRGFSGILLRVSAGAQPAYGAGCAVCGDQAEESELDSRSGHSRAFWILFHTAPGFMKVVRIKLAADRPL